MIVLDTHVLLWVDRDDPSLGAESRKLIVEQWRIGEVAICAISFWEVSVLARRGRIAMPLSVELWRSDLIQAGLREIPLDGRIAVLSTGFEELHKDPADRFIAATALHHGAVLLTADQKLLDWRSDLRRHDARQ